MGLSELVEIWQWKVVVGISLASVCVMGGLLVETAFNDQLGWPLSAIAAAVAGWLGFSISGAWLGVLPVWVIILAALPTLATCWFAQWAGRLIVFYAAVLRVEGLARNQSQALEMAERAWWEGHWRFWDPANKKIAERTKNLDG